MDKTWYNDKYNSQLTDTKFYQRLSEDINANIDRWVTKFSKDWVPLARFRRAGTSLIFDFYSFLFQQVEWFTSSFPLF